MAYRYVNKNPRLQARIFLSNWFVKVVRPGKEMPDDVVQMHVSMDMSRIDVKNYLEKIYNIKVHRVNTRIQYGRRESVMQMDGSIVKRKYADFKIAYVTLAEGKFKFPELFAPAQIEERPELEAAPVKEAPATPPEIPEHIKRWISP